MIRRVYSYVNNVTATEKQAIDMMEHDLGYPLKIIPKSQVNHYTSKYGTAVWVLCLSDTCKRMIYVTPKSRKPHYSDYQKLLASAKRRGMKILPKIKVDLDNFPAHHYSIAGAEFSIEVEIKPLSNIVLQSSDSKSPLTYTPGKLLNVKYSESNKINDYVKAWNKISIVEVDRGQVKLKIGNSLTNEVLNLDAAVEGNTFTTTISTRPSKIALGRKWVIEGNLSMQIKGSVFPLNPKGHVQSSFSKPLPNGHKTYYTSYILLGIGLTALGLATFGVGDAIALPALGAVTLATTR